MLKTLAYKTLHNFSRAIHKLFIYIRLQKNSFLSLKDFCNIINNLYSIFFAELIRNSLPHSPFCYSAIDLEYGKFVI